jgi:hypothetical protein
MGSRWLAAAIEGDVLDNLDIVLEVFGQRRLGELKSTQSWEEASAFTDNRNSLGNPIGACVVKKWTVLLEPRWELSGSIFEQVERSQLLARTLRTRVFATYTHSVACAYAYRLFDGEQMRSVWVGDDRIEDLGPKIPGEPVVDEESYNDESLLDVMAILDLDICEGVEQAGHYILLTIASATESVKAHTADNRRPWWKFW